MDTLTPQGAKIVDYLAQKYTVGSDAVMILLDALLQGNGDMAQFNHPDLGGMGQWSRGGMIMIGDMFNDGLKAKVEGLCAELGDLARRESARVQSGDPTSELQNATGVCGEFSLFASSPGGAASAWWNPELGMPTATGSQNNLSYAWFRSSRRLAIRVGGRVFVYDTGDYEITGISQQQGADASLSFLSQHGLVRLSDLRGVSTGGGGERQSDHKERPPRQREKERLEIPLPRRPIFGSETQSDDIFLKLERLADLQKKGIISDEEFASKKAELLERL